MLHSRRKIVIVSGEYDILLTMNAEWKASVSDSAAAAMCRYTSSTDSRRLDSSVRPIRPFSSGP